MPFYIQVIHFIPCELRARFLARSGPSKMSELCNFCRRSLKKRRCVATLRPGSSLLKLTDSVWHGLKSFCLTAWRAASTTLSFFTSTAVTCCFDICVARSFRISEGLASIQNLLWIKKKNPVETFYSKQLIYYFCVNISIYSDTEQTISNEPVQSKHHVLLLPFRYEWWVNARETSFNQPFLLLSFC